MAKGYSKDLRARAVALVEDGEEIVEQLEDGERLLWGPVAGDEEGQPALEA